MDEEEQVTTLMYTSGVERQGTMVQLVLLGSLRYLVQAPEIGLAPGSIKHILQQLKSNEDELFRRIAPEGKLSRAIKIFVNNIVIDELAGYETEVRPGDEVCIVVASSGG